MYIIIMTKMSRPKTLSLVNCIIKDCKNASLNYLVFFEATRKVKKNKKTTAFGLLSRSQNCQVSWVVLFQHAILMQALQF